MLSYPPFYVALVAMSTHYLTDTTPIVAFDTIFEQCSIAIMADGQVIYAKTVSGGRGQTEIILPMLDEALQATGIHLAQVAAWAFNRGPGAFSGIRINTAVAQALSVANAAPCIGISSLHALAIMACEHESATEGMRITAVMDARQNQVYAGDFVVCDGELIAKEEYLLDYKKNHCSRPHRRRWGEFGRDNRQEARPKPHRRAHCSSGVSFIHQRSDCHCQRCPACLS